jgi:hypothetical protein
MKKRGVILAYSALFISALPCLLYTLEYFTNFQIHFLPSWLFYYLLFLCPFTVFACSILVIAVAQGRNKWIGVASIIMLLAWYIFFANLINDNL